MQKLSESEYVKNAYRMLLAAEKRSFFVYPEKFTKTDLHYSCVLDRRYTSKHFAISINF
jgi:hypothetical protein